MLPELCQNCKKVKFNLIICPFCHAKVCNECFDFERKCCKICNGKLQGK